MKINSNDILKDIIIKLYSKNIFDELISSKVNLNLIESIEKTINEVCRLEEEECKKLEEANKNEEIINEKYKNNKKKYERKKFFDGAKVHKGSKGGGRTSAVWTSADTFGWAWIDEPAGQGEWRTMQRADVPRAGIRRGDAAGDGWESGGLCEVARGVYHGGAFGGLHTGHWV